MAQLKSLSRKKSWIWFRSMSKLNIWEPDYCTETQTHWGCSKFLNFLYFFSFRCVNISVITEMMTHQKLVPINFSDSWNAPCQFLNPWTPTPSFRISKNLFLFPTEIRELCLWKIPLAAVTLLLCSYLHGLRQKGILPYIFFWLPIGLKWPFEIKHCEVTLLGRFDAILIFQDKSLPSKTLVPQQTQSLHSCLLQK